MNDLFVIGVCVLINWIFIIWLDYKQIKKMKDWENRVNYLEGVEK